MWTHVAIIILLFVYVGLLCSTGAAIILENRQPSKTIAWVIVIWCLPIIGLILFYFFGADIRRKHRILRCDYDKITLQMLAVSPPDNGVTYPDSCRSLIEPLQSRFNCIAKSHNLLSIITVGSDFVHRLLKDIAHAKHHIHIEIYIMEDDAVGRPIAECLMQHAREGIEVRLLYDDVGCWKVSDKFFNEISSAGVEVEAFQPVRFPSLTNKVNYRNHRKIMVIDGKVGYIGGMNFAQRYAPDDDEEWRDTQLRVYGENVAALQRIFLSDWYFATQRLLADSKYFPICRPKRANCLMQMVSSTPFSPFRHIEYSMAWLFQNARKNIFIQTPYFIPGETILQALRMAALRGVDVQVMVPLKPDSRLLRYANESYFEDVLSVGIRIFVYTKGFLHAKTFMVDGKVCSIGSANMDLRSFSDNFEANAYIYNSHIAKHMERIFAHDRLNCREIKHEKWLLRPLWRRILESHTRLLSPLL